LCCGGGSRSRELWPELFVTGLCTVLTWEVPDPERWVPAGYAVIVVDARGTGKSPGFYEMMAPLQTREYYDAIEWAGTQSWSNGKVGLLGVSYLAIKQWQVAALQPPHLAAIIPWEGMFDHYRDLYRHGGIYSSFFLKLLWDSQIATNQNGNAETPYRDRFTSTVSTGNPINSEILAGNRANVYQAGLQHPFDDAYFKVRTPVAERIEVPLLSAGNWGGLGLHLRGNIEPLSVWLRGKSGSKCTRTRISRRCISPRRWPCKCVSLIIS
jgi:putative CocE/NonD family hydrolase